MKDKNEKNLTARFTIDDIVCVDCVCAKCVVVGVHFTPTKVKYDVEVIGDDELNEYVTHKLHGVDSLFVHEYDESRLKNGVLVGILPGRTPNRSSDI